MIKANPQIKTIKFEARPVWETKIHVKRFSDENSKDAMRNASYPKTKEILNRYVVEVMRKALEQITTTDMEPTYANLRMLFGTKGENKILAQKYKKAVDDFKKYISSAMKEVGEEYQLVKAQSRLFDEKKSMLLSGEVISLTEEEKDLVRLYHNFTGYWSKYFTTVADVTMCGVEYGSVANRIIENMERYFKNEAYLQELMRVHSDLPIREHLKRMDVKMTITQDGVDAYNELIGNTSNTGINNLINEYRQKNKVRIIYVKNLDKIPMFGEKKQIVVESVETKEQASELIKDVLMDAETLVDFAKELIKSGLTEKDDIVVKEKSLPRLSQRIYGKWDVLKKVLNAYCIENAITYKDITLSLLEKSIANGEIMPNCGIVDFVKEEMAKTGAAWKDEPVIMDICKNQSVKENKKKVKEFFEGLLIVKQTMCLFDTENPTSIFAENVNALHDAMVRVNQVFNMIRNYCTKNPIKKDSFPVYFDKPSALGSFDYDKFMDGISISSILRKDGKYYLLMLNPEHSTKLPKQAFVENGGYEQLVYKQLPGLNKAFPKIFFSEVGKSLYQPSAEIKYIKEAKLYTKEAGDKESLRKWIAFCIESFKKNKEWMKYYNPTFRKPEEYESANEFYTELERCTIHMDFSSHLSEEYIRKAVAEGEVFLFEIYNKDFSPNHHGNDDPYTRLFKQMFSSENLQKLNNSDETAIKLASGGSTLVYRKASLPYAETHPANVPIANKNPLNEKKESVFNYAICKNRRFMTDKYILSLAVQVGFRNEEISKYELNRRVNKELIGKKPNILAVRAGERHLLYYVVTDFDGNILEQKSLNVIHSESRNGKVQTDYKRILSEREQTIAKEKESWNYSVDIKDIKTGYLTQAINEIVKVQQKYNAVICVEDYNSSFVQSRMKNMKNVYQQFQSKLLQKLSCFVPAGGIYTDAIQLAAPVSSMEDLKGQSGIVFFVNTSCTANMDPSTGFVNLFSHQFVYENMAASVKTMEKLDNIEPEEDGFKITISEKKFGFGEKTWELHTAGVRSVYKDKKCQKFDCSSEMRELFREYQIGSLKDAKQKKLPKDFYERFFEIIRVMCAMHYYDADTDTEYTFSPVLNRENKQFRTSRGEECLPKNATAVKTYLMGIKGLRDIQMINEDTLLVQRDERGTHVAKWIEYVRKGKIIA